MDLYNKIKNLYKTLYKFFKNIIGYLYIRN